MKKIRINEANFEYDIHSLVKAFFPGEEVRVICEAAGEEEVVSRLGGGKRDRVPRDQEGAKETEDVFLSIRYCHQPEELVISTKQAHKLISLENADRIETKNRLKRGIYEILSADTKTTLPWGTLTGIRPVKIPMAFLQEGKDEAWIHHYMRETYLVGTEKTALSLEVAQREAALLKRLDYREGYSLYIGIPFCPSTCLYCSFPSFPLSGWAGRMEEYLTALERELDFTAERFRGRKLNTIYIGGGTPTTLTAEQLERLLTKIAQIFSLEQLMEYTVEAGRPDSISREKLLVLKEHGITRISINPQTMNQETLDLIGRRHTVEQTKESFALARELGFDNINMDLIVGLPGEALLQVEQTMEAVKKLRPDSLTVHSLAVKRASRLRMHQEEYEGLSMVNTWEIIDLTAQTARGMGLMPYYLYRQKNMAGNFENVGYAAAGKEGLYNILIMEEVQTIIAVGAGSISKRVYPDGRIERCENVKDVALYIEKIDEMIERKRKLLADF